MKNRHKNRQNAHTDLARIKNHGRRRKKSTLKITEIPKKKHAETARYKLKFGRLRPFSELPHPLSLTHPPHPIQKTLAHLKVRTSLHLTPSLPFPFTFTLPLCNSHHPALPIVIHPTLTLTLTQLLYYPSWPKSFVHVTKRDNSSVPTLLWALLKALRKSSYVTTGTNSFSDGTSYRVMRSARQYLQTRLSSCVVCGVVCGWGGGIEGGGREEETTKQKTGFRCAVLTAFECC
jgi:hypothetical protein